MSAINDPIKGVLAVSREDLVMQARAALENPGASQAPKARELATEIKQRARNAAGLPRDPGPQQMQLAELDRCVDALASLPQEPAPSVEVWNGSRKVTVYPPNTVLRVWGPNIDTEMSEEPFSLKSVNDAFQWLFASLPKEPALCNAKLAAVIKHAVGSGPNDVCIEWRGGIAAVGTELYVAESLTRQLSDTANAAKLFAQEPAHGRKLVDAAMQVVRSYDQWAAQVQGGALDDSMRPAVKALHEEAETLGISLDVAAQEPASQEAVAWTLQETLDKRETTCSAHLWFTDPGNSGWAPLYTGPAAPSVKQSLTVEQAWTDNCWCEACDVSKNGLRTHMSICPKCGDKRCLRAGDHRNTCSAEQIDSAPEGEQQ